MPHAIERLLATPRIRPRLPRMMPEASAMIYPAALPILLWHRGKAPSSEGPRELRSNSRLARVEYFRRRLLSDYECVQGPANVMDGLHPRGFSPSPSSDHKACARAICA